MWQIRQRQNISNLYYIIRNNIINQNINMYNFQYFADASPILMEKIPETDIISSWQLKMVMHAMQGNQRQLDSFAYLLYLSNVVFCWPVNVLEWQSALASARRRICAEILKPTLILTDLQVCKIRTVKRLHIKLRRSWGGWHWIPHIN